MRAKMAVSAALLLGMAASARAESPEQKYVFGTSRPGYTGVPADAVYSKEKGYGFDLGSGATTKGTAWRAVHPGEKHTSFLFSAKLDPGVYRVTVTLGGADQESVTTVKSETRRLMVEEAKAGAGQTVEKHFLVHVRVPTLPDGSVVRMKPRENEPMLYVEWDEKFEKPFLELDWDEKLTLEFSSASVAAVQAVDIAPAGPHTTVYLVGDSTMTDQMMEPWAAWGQMLPRFFKEPVVIANYAECGETAASFIGEKRWPKIMSEISKGDYVFMQFGINDRGTPADRFKGYFETMIKEAREKGAIPVLVTSQNLKRLGPDGKGVETLGIYPGAMREVAEAQKTPLIDLNQMSMVLYGAMGPEGINHAFVDGTHHSDWGAYELCKCVVSEILRQKIGFQGSVTEDWKGFDPATPDPYAGFSLPADPQLDPARPGGPGLANGQGAMAAAPPRAPRAGGRGGAANAAATQGATTRP